MRRLFLGPAEREHLAHSGILQRDDGTLEIVLYFDGRKPDYAATVPPRLARTLRRFLEDSMDAIDPLLIDDARGYAPSAPVRRS